MAGTITTAVVTGGSNSHATTVGEVNAFRSDFCSPGVTGTISNTAGVSPATGSFAVNAQGTPAMFVDVSLGAAYITATPAGQASQLLRASQTATWTSYAISSNSSGSTKYDWVYLSVDATKANNPSATADDVTALYTSRSSSNTTDNASPPTYGILLAVITVANGATSISNANISDGRYAAAITPVTTSTYFFDFVESGCVWTADSAGSTLNASMTSGYIWISGKRLRVAAVSARAFTASKDTYVDLSDNGDGTAAFTYTAATTNAASSALASNAIRIAIVVSGAGSIAAAASINQGQEDRVLPIASSIPYSVTDSLGNLICPRDPNRKLLGYRQAIVNRTTASTTAVAVTELACPVIIPTGRKVKITLWGGRVFNNTNADGSQVSIYRAASLSTLTTQLAISSAFSGTGVIIAFPLYVEAVYSPAAGLIFFNGAFNAVTGGTTQIDGATTSPSYIKVELV